MTYPSQQPQQPYRRQQYPAAQSPQQYPSGNYPGQPAARQQPHGRAPHGYNQPQQPYPGQYRQPPQHQGRPILALASLVLGIVVLLGTAAVTTLMVLDPAAPPGSSIDLQVAAVDLPEQEQTEAGARAAAQEAFDLYSSGSYGEFWDRWSAQSQQFVSRDDYMRLFRLCPQIAQNLRFTITSVTVNGATAKVQANRLIGAFTFDFVYEGKAWRYALPADQQQEYRSKSVDQMAQERLSSQLRQCGSTSQG